MPYQGEGELERHTEEGAGELSFSSPLSPLRLSFPPIWAEKRELGSLGVASFPPLWSDGVAAAAPLLRSTRKGKKKAAAGTPPLFPLYPVGKVLLPPPPPLPTEHTQFRFSPQIARRRTNEQKPFSPFFARRGKEVRQ